MSCSTVLIKLPSRAWLRDELNCSRSLPPLGLLYIGAYLRRYGYSVRLIDLMVNSMSRKQFEQELFADRVDVVGISSFVENYPFAIEVAEMVKELRPDCTVVLGGPAPTVLVKECFQSSCVDYVVRFEGEDTFRELLDSIGDGASIDPEVIKGIAFKDGEKIRINPRRKLISDLDAMPFPDRGLIEKSRYAQPFSILTSRGCPKKCSFCSAQRFWTRKYRARSAENIFEEVSWLVKKYEARDFHVIDDTFTVDHERIYRFCELLQSSNLNMLWKCESRVDTVDEKLMKTMYKAGCRELVFGIESGVDEILRSIDKDVDARQVEATVSSARKIGFKVLTLFMIGHPADTVETMEQTVKFMAHLSKDYGCHNRVSVNTPFPGTYQYEHAQELGLKIHSTKWEDFGLTNPNISTPRFSLETLRKIYSEARKLCYDLETQGTN